MNHFDEILNTGQGILDSVTEAVNKNDYSSLSKNIQTQVTNLTQDIQNSRQQANHQRQRPNTMPAGMYREQMRKAKGTPFCVLYPRYANATFKIVFGIFGMVLVFFSGISALFINSIVYPDEKITTILGTIALFALAAWLTNSGRKDKVLVTQFYKYARLCGYEEHISIAKLARIAGETDEMVVSNIERMMKKGFLPQAKFDANKKTLMLTDAVYSEYMDNVGKSIAAEEVRSAKQDAIDKLDVSEEVKQTIREGQQFLDYIKAANAKIDDAEMSKKLDKMHAIVERIFAKVTEDPASAGALNKLMTYYLPTTRKLINAYLDMDKQNIESANIAETKSEIEGAMDVINEAFGNLFNSLFQDVAWDISSEVSVMKTMMAQDGLSNKVNKL